MESPDFVGLYMLIQVGMKGRKEEEREEDQAGYSGVVWAQRQQLCAFCCMENLALMGLHMLIQVGMKGRKEEEREEVQAGYSRIVWAQMENLGFTGLHMLIQVGTKGRKEEEREEDQAGHPGVVWAQRQQLCAFGSMEKLVAHVDPGGNERQEEREEDQAGYFGVVWAQRQQLCAFCCMENLALPGFHMLIQVGMKGRKEEEREGRGERGGPGRILPDSLGSETAVVCFLLHGEPGSNGVAHVDQEGKRRERRTRPDTPG